MNRLHILVVVAVIALYTPFFFMAMRAQTVPYNFEGNRAVALTNAKRLQLLNPLEYLGLFLNESSTNPYVYGWENDTLYFKDRYGRSYRWNSMASSQGKIKSVVVEEPRFLRQEKKYDNCNITNRPNYSEKMKNSYPGGVDKISCFSYQQGSTTVELWPLELSGILATHYRRVVIEYNNKKVTSDEPRLVSDVVISEDGKFVAITASQPQSYPEPFAATDVYVIELK